MVFLQSDLGLFILRFAVGLIFLIHGLQKRGMWKMQPSAEMPSKMINIMKLLSVVEPLGAIALIIGIMPQTAAAVLALVMAGAIYFKIIVWKKKMTEPGGWEFDLILLAANLAILLTGGGNIKLF